MKSILIAVNVMLAILAAGEVIKCINEKEDIRPTRTATIKEQARTSAKPLPVAAPVQNDPKWMEEQVNVISALNIFSPDRTPEIPTTAKRMAANNTRGEMRLVGTFEMNGTRGAIILQRTNQRNGNRNFGFGGGFGMGGFGGMGFGMNINTPSQNTTTAESPAEEVSQAQIDDARQRLTQLQSVLQTLQRNNASADQLASVTRQIEAQNTLLQQLMTIATEQKSSADGLASITATDSNNVRQYLKIGESTADGYMLLDVTRTSATLRRNNDVIELTMQKASDNQEAMALAASRANSAQVIVSDSTPATTPSTPSASSNGSRRSNGGFGDFGGFGGGDFGGFGGGDFGDGNGGFGGFGGGNGDFGGFGGGNGGFGGGNGGFGGGNNNSRTNAMTGGNNRSGMNSANHSSSTMSSTSSRGNTSSRTGINTSSAGRSTSTSTRSNAAGRTGANSGNRAGGASMGRR